MKRLPGMLLFLTVCSNSHSATHNVGSAAELETALNSASGGDSIVLSPGQYGPLELTEFRFDSFVTLRSNVPSSPAVFSRVVLTNCQNIGIDQVEVVVEGREGFGIFGDSSNIKITNSKVAGSQKFDRSAPNYTQVSTLYGVNVGGSPLASSIEIERVSVTDVKSSAYLFTNISNSTMRNNYCDWVASDCYKFAGADGILFENNFGAQNVYSSPTAHIDFVQGQGAVSNSIFRGNVALMGSASFQGLFFDDAEYTNLTFENNLIHNANIRGISVSSGSGIVARYNTVLTVADPAGNSGRYSRASLILLPSGSVNEKNIVANITTKNEQRFDNNVVSQWDDDDDVAHYSDFYVNAMAGPFAKVSDFEPIAGSLADGQFGAFARIMEILSPSTPSPSPNSNVNMMPMQMLLLDGDS